MIIIPPKRSRSQTDELDRLYRYAITKDQMARFTAEMRSARIAAVSRMLAPQRYGALGEEVLAVDPDVFFKIDAIHPGAWSDDTFIREFARDNPHSRPIKPQKRIFNGF